MKVTYLGTGAAEGIPALFCNCAFCKGARARKEVRSRSHILIDGELGIEFPPDVFYQAAVLGADLSAIKYVLVTHSHMDHFYAHDFVMRGYKYAYDMTTPDLAIYANAEVCEVFRECTRRELREDVGEHITLNAVSAYEEVCFGDYKVYPLKAKHSSTEPLVYAIEKGEKRILHLTDTGIFPEENYLYLSQVFSKPFDLVTFDCTLLFDPTEPRSRHMGLDENMRTKARLKELGLVDGHTKLVITHFSHNGNPTPERIAEAEKQYGVIGAYDGMTLEI